MVGFSQHEGLSVLGQGPYGWPECEEFRAFWERTGVVGFSQDDGLSALGQSQCGRQECEEFRAFWRWTGAVSFSQHESLSILGPGQYGSMGMGGQNAKNSEHSGGGKGWSAFRRMRV